MASALQQELGSLFCYSAVSFANFVLSGTNYGCAFCVQAPDALTITALGFRYGVRTGTPPTYRISLQSLSATTGDPDGTVLGGASPASATFTPPASTAWNSTFQWVTLANAYTCARGQILAIVIDYSSGTCDASNNGSFTNAYSGTGMNATFPYYQTETAGTWSKTLRIPCVGYQTASASYGYPVNAIAQSSTGTLSTPDELAMAFALPAAWASTYQVLGARFSIRTPANSTSFDLLLYDGTTVLQSVTMDADMDAAGAGAERFIELYFDEATLSTLTCGSLYRLALKPNDTTTSVGLFVFTTNSAQDCNAFNGGATFYYSTRTDAGAWSDDTASRPWMSLILGDITPPAGGGGGLLINPGLSGGLR